MISFTLTIKSENGQTILEPGGLKTENQSTEEHLMSVYVMNAIQLAMEALKNKMAIMNGLPPLPPTNNIHLN